MTLNRRTIILATGALAAGVPLLGFRQPERVPENVLTNSTTALPIKESVDTISTAKLEKLEMVIKEMMDRSQKDPGDPKGWLINADPHRAFCSAPGSGGLNQIHFCYWFLPWHRAYLSVLDKKIQALSGDKSLVFPYWNWSSNRRLPPAFTRVGSPLANAVRYTPNRSLADSEIDYHRDNIELAKLGVAALAATKFVANTTTDLQVNAFELRESFGGVARPNQHRFYGNSRLEGTPHGPIHVYVGGTSATGQNGDMTDFATAARDPAFFAHHGNLDRLWEIWRKQEKNKAHEPSTSEFLERVFAFPWIDGSIMEVSVADTLDTKRLGFTYDSLDVFASQNVGTPIPEAALPTLPPIVDTLFTLPPVPEAILKEQARYYLIIEGPVTPQRPLSAGVYVSSKDRNVQILVGSIDVVKNGDEFKPLDEVLLFDVTTAVRQLQTHELRLTIVPNEIGGEGVNPYQSLRYKNASVIIK
jgi:hypothetical protein